MLQTPAIERIAALIVSPPKWKTRHTCFFSILPALFGPMVDLENRYMLSPHHNLVGHHYVMELPQNVFDDRCNMHNTTFLCLCAHLLSAKKHYLRKRIESTTVCGKRWETVVAPCLSFWCRRLSSEPYDPLHRLLYTSAGSSSSTVTKQQILVKKDPNNATGMLFLTSMAFLYKDSFFLWIFSMMLWNCEGTGSR